MFSVLTDLINLEKLKRMEQVHLRGDDSDDLDGYEYVPEALLTSVLDRLTMVAPPRYGSKLCSSSRLASHTVVTMYYVCIGCLSFSMHPQTIGVQKLVRRKPPDDTPEHIEAGVEWALPTLMSWLPVDNIVWLLSLLLCEVKVLVLGSEAGMVSCVVMSLLALMRPLSWVAPLIP
jgi:hypothetical protein